MRREAWLELNVGGEIITMRGGDIKGVARPWMGMHTIDTVRRDAGESGMRFEVSFDEAKDRAEVTVWHEKGRLIYSVDMSRDVVEKIEIVAGDVQGELALSYLQEIDGVGGEFVEPLVRGAKGVGGIEWLLELCD